jgi:predicted short-subunit dehydrogenase-like oxidoreductase (DUF2520 family)
LVTASPNPRFPFSFVLVGAGRVGTAVGRLLLDAGHSITGVASRSASSAERAARFLSSPVFSLDVDLPRSDVVLLGVTDPGLETTVKSLASSDVSGRVVWHLSGSLGLAPLKPVIDREAFGCALHPVQACPDVPTAIERLPGSAWGVTTSAEVGEWARRTIGESLGGRSVIVAEGDRSVWHSASVTVSNGIAALMASGEAALDSIGVEEPAHVLGPLAHGTLANAVEGGGGGATLTGPVVRGEADTIRRHLSALRALDANLADSYALVATFIIDQAERAGRIDREAASEMQALLRYEL